MSETFGVEPPVGFDKSTKSFAGPVVILSSPLVTLVILFPPLLSPSFVKDTALSVSGIFVPGFAGSSFPGVIVTPSFVTLVSLPSLSLVVVPVGPTVVVLVPSVVVVPVGVVTTEFPDVSFTSTFDKSFNSFANE